MKIDQQVEQDLSFFHFEGSRNPKRGKQTHVVSCGHGGHAKASGQFRCHIDGLGIGHHRAWTTTKSHIGVCLTYMVSTSTKWLHSQTTSKIIYVLPLNLYPIFFQDNREKKSFNFPLFKVVTLSSRNNVLAPAQLLKFTMGSTSSHASQRSLPVGVLKGSSVTYRDSCINPTVLYT